MASGRPTVRRWTVKQYLRAAEAGVFRGQRVELIEGVIVQMPPQKERHYAVIERPRRALEPAFGTGYWARTQAPLQFGPRSAPEPDVALVTGAPGDYSTHPTTALLIVEVSETTLWFDRRRKASLYARAGIADYWIVNLRDHVVEVRRHPAPDSAARYGYSYADLTTLRAGDRIAPLAAPHASVAVADLMP